MAKAWCRVKRREFYGFALERFDLQKPKPLLSVDLAVVGSGNMHAQFDASGGAFAGKLSFETLLT